MVHPGYVKDARGGPSLGAAGRFPASWLQKDFQHLCRQKLRCMSHTDLLIRFSFSCENEVLLWNSLIRNLLGWHLSDDQAGIENILIGILFLRNKS